MICTSCDPIGAEKVSRSFAKTAPLKGNILFVDAMWLQYKCVEFFPMFWCCEVVGLQYDSLAETCPKNTDLRLILLVQSTCAYYDNVLHCWESIMLNQCVTSFVYIWCVSLVALSDYQVWYINISDWVSTYRNFDNNWLLINYLLLIIEFS